MTPRLEKEKAFNEQTYKTDYTNTPIVQIVDFREKFGVYQAHVVGDNLDKYIGIVPYNEQNYINISFEKNKYIRIDFTEEANKAFYDFFEEFQSNKKNITKETNVELITNKTKPLKGRTVDEITKEIEEGIKEIFNSENYKKYLQTMSKFYDYSSRNVLLIYSQNQKATHIAGFQSWKTNFKRYVRKGEKGIKIIAPISSRRMVDTPKLDEKQNPILDEKGKVATEKKQVSFLNFKVVRVFDISQTEGEKLPKLGIEKEKGNIKNIDEWKDLLSGLAPCPIIYEETKKMSARGYFDPSKNIIGIQEGLNSVQTIKTMLHEIIHAYAHSKENISKGLTRGAEEIQAESTAFVIASYFGIDTSNYSFPYVASWSEGKETEALKGELETIQEISSTMIDSMDRRINDTRETGKEYDSKKIQARISAVCLSINKIEKSKNKDILSRIYANELNDFSKRYIPEGRFKNEMISLMTECETFDKLKKNIQNIENDIIKSGRGLTVNEMIKKAETQLKENNKRRER